MAARIFINILIFYDNKVKINLKRIDKNNKDWNIRQFFVFSNKNILKYMFVFMHFINVPNDYTVIELNN